MDKKLLDYPILIIDDQQANTEVLENLLALKGYNNVTVLNDSTKAFSLIQSLKPGLLLLDLMMPVVSGFDILNQWRSLKGEKDFMQILVLTADSTRNSKNAALASGANDFLVKPLDLSEVELRIKNLLTTYCLLVEFENLNQNLEAEVAKRTQELLATNEALVANNIALKEIAWVQSHVVRAPLARLMGLMNLIEAEPDLELLNSFNLKEKIMDSAKELDTIIRDITNKTYAAKVLDN